MISVDANVVVRLLTGDHQSQFKRAKALFAKENIVITTSVILECEWVLRYAYHFNPLKIAGAFQSLFGISTVKLQDQLVIYNAIKWYKQGLDFADAVHLAKSQDAESLVTFDKKLRKTASKIINFPVSEP